MRYLLLFCIIFISSQVNSEVLDTKSLAQCLKSRGAVMYGSPKCGHCKKLIESFGGHFQSEGLRFVNCKGSGRSECRRQRVGPYPKWVFNNGNSVSRPHNLHEIAVASGCAAIQAPVQEDRYERPMPVGQARNSIEGIAECLTAKGVTFFGSPECGHCKHEKEWFGPYFHKVNMNNCIGSSAERAKCKRLRTYPFPTWLQESTGRRIARPSNIEELANYFGCASQPEIMSAPPVQEPQQPQQPQSTWDINSLLYPTGLTDDQRVNVANCLNKEGVELFINKDEELSNRQIIDLGSASGLIQIVNCSKGHIGSPDCMKIGRFPTWSVKGQHLTPAYHELPSIARIVGCPIQ